MHVPKAAHAGMTEGLPENAILGKSKADFYKDLDSMDKTPHHDGLTEHGERLQHPSISKQHFHGKNGTSANMLSPTGKLSVIFVPPA